MDNRFIFADRHGLLCRLGHNHDDKKSSRHSINNEQISVRTNSETDLTNTKSSESSYATDTALGSSIEYLNLCVGKDSKKTDSFFHLFSNDNSTCVHQRKTVTIMEPGGHKFHPVKSIKKEKINDGSKKIIECNLTRKYFLDISSSCLSALSRTISKANHITHLYIYSNKISKLPKELGQLTNLKELWMQENNIDYLPSEMKNCKQLRHLDLRHNHLGDECLVVLKYFTHLEILLMTHNKLTRLDGIGRLRKLENLAVKSNRLEGCLTKSIGKLVNLMSLDLSKNRIISIPKELGSCSNLRRLNLEYNNLTHIPDTIGDLQKLETIGLKYNSLESLPYSLSNCIYLKELNVENNNIEELPNDLYLNLIGATKLIISHNNFTSLPKGLTKQYVKTQKINAEYNHIKRLAGILAEAEVLKVLNLACNNVIEILPGDLINMKNLVELNLSFNHLVELPKDIGNLDHLESLDLTNNNLNTLPSSIGCLKRLVNLTLESNCISDLPFEFGELDKLKTLNISSNQIKSLPISILGLKYLEILNLSDNFIDELPENINNLSRLTHLFLKDNKLINSLPINLVHMKNLSFLSLSGCPLREIPSEYSKSPVTVMAYLRALEIGLRLKEYIQAADENRSSKDLFSSDSNIHISSSNSNIAKRSSKPVESSTSASSGGITNKQGLTPAPLGINSHNKTPNQASYKKVNPPTKVDDIIRPRSYSASVASKKPPQKTAAKVPASKISIPDDLIRKMKTTEAGFMACSKSDSHKK